MKTDSPHSGETDTPTLLPLSCFVIFDTMHSLEVRVNYNMIPCNNRNQIFTMQWLWPVKILVPLSV